MWLLCQNYDLASMSGTWWAGGLCLSYCSTWASTYEKTVVIRSCFKWSHLFSWIPALHSACSPSHDGALECCRNTVVQRTPASWPLSKAYGVHHMASIQDKILLCSSTNQKSWTLPDLDDSWGHFSVSWLLPSLPSSRHEHWPSSTYEHAGWNEFEII